SLVIRVAPTARGAGCLTGRRKLPPAPGAQSRARDNLSQRNHVWRNRFYNLRHLWLLQGCYTLYDAYNRFRFSGARMQCQIRILRIRRTC
ncbi:MAG: hypothetical protein BJ554DRAFT_772, partial [Olpidium bornovanus]